MENPVMKSKQKNCKQSHLDAVSGAVLLRIELKPTSAIFMQGGEAKAILHVLEMYGI